METYWLEVCVVNRVLGQKHGLDLRDNIWVEHDSSCWLVIMTFRVVEAAPSTVVNEETDSMDIRTHVVPQHFFDRQLSLLTDWSLIPQGFRVRARIEALGTLSWHWMERRKPRKNQPTKEETKRGREGRKDVTVLFVSSFLFDFKRVQG